MNQGWHLHPGVVVRKVVGSCVIYLPVDPFICGSIYLLIDLSMNLLNYLALVLFVSFFYLWFAVFSFLTCTRALQGRLETFKGPTVILQKGWF